MINLLRHLASRHGLFVVIASLILGAFEFLICAIVVNFDLGAVITQAIKSLPPLMQTMMADQFFGGFTTRGILAFGWNHPTALVIGLAVAIVLASRAIAGEIESGTMEMTLTQPLSRITYLAAQCMFAFICLAVLTAGALLGSIIGQAFFNLAVFRASDLFKLGSAYFLLQSAWFGISLAASSFSREGGRVAVLVFIIALVLYVINVIGKLLPTAEGLLPYSLWTYYSPQMILVNGTFETKSVLVLAGTFIVSVGLGAWYFQRRDIP
jgi:ABC-type transport system involved in multi-copper enzyme maturation permease subunit